MTNCKEQMTTYTWKLKAVLNSAIQTIHRNSFIKKKKKQKNPRKLVYTFKCFSLIMLMYLLGSKVDGNGQSSGLEFTAMT